MKQRFPIIRVWILAITITITITGCFYPTFDEDVSLAAGTKRKLEFLHSVSTQVEQKTYQYFPVPTSNPGGFLAGREQDYPLLYYLSAYGFKGPIESPSPVPTVEGLDLYSVYVFGYFSTNPCALFYFPGWGVSSGIRDLMVFSYSTSTQELQEKSSKMFLSDIAIPLYFLTAEPSATEDDLLVLGMQLRSAAAENEVQIDSLIFYKTEKRYYELSFRIDTNGTATFDSNIVLSRDGQNYLSFEDPVFGVDTSLDADPPRVRYFYSPFTQYSYANCLIGGTYCTFSWGQGTEPQNTQIKGKIVSVLSSGDILSEKGPYGYIYKPGGKLRF
ncbi:MAG TPA: hypothetical protein PLG79_14775, partial [Spirochaetales bacterium]|nr:hypothetical protein [Spirochaetales bacterium]